MFLANNPDLQPDRAGLLVKRPVFRNFHFIIKAYTLIRQIDIRHTARHNEGQCRRVNAFSEGICG
jgi:hypothetical protein